MSDSTYVSADIDHSQRLTIGDCVIPRDKYRYAGAPSEIIHIYGKDETGRRRAHLNPSIQGKVLWYLAELRNPDESVTL